MAESSSDSDEGFRFLALSEELFQCLDLIDHYVTVVSKLKKFNQELKKRHFKQNCFKNCRYNKRSLFTDYISMLKDMENLVSEKLNDQTLNLNIQTWFDTFCEIIQNVQKLEVETLSYAESHLSLDELKRLF